jgi:hypothetical protein
MAELPRPPINQELQGFLDFLALRQMGQNPRFLQSEVQPILDLFDWYAQPQGTDVDLATLNLVAASAGALDAAPTTPPLPAVGNILTVPQGSQVAGVVGSELWLVLEAAVVWQFAADAAQRGSFGLKTGSGTGNFFWPMQSNGFDAGVAGVTQAGFATLLHPVWIKPGATISYWSNGHQIGAANITLRGWLRLLRLTV